MNGKVKLNQKIKLTNASDSVTFTGDITVTNDEGVVKAGYCLYKNRSFFVELDPRNDCWEGQYAL